MISLAGEQAKCNYDTKVQLQPNFQIGDKVLLRHDNIATDAPSRKLSSKFLGSFSIISKLSDVVYRLKLQKTSRIHDVFHVSLLERFSLDTIAGRQLRNPPPVITLEGDLEYEVDRILD